MASVKSRPSVREQSAAERQAGYAYQRARRMPEMVEATEHKLKALLAEARRYGTDELVNATWDRVILEAQAQARANGDSIGFGDGVR